jgi:hypothetical protein
MFMFDVSTFLAHTSLISDIFAHKSQEKSEELYNSDFVCIRYFAALNSLYVYLQ